MYSYEDKTRAVELYIKYDKCAADVVLELGYPSTRAVKLWYEEYLEEQETGIKHHDRCRGNAKYTDEQKQNAVNHYIEHGRRLSRTVKMLGYPTKQALSSWIDEFAPGQRKLKLSAGSIQFTLEQKIDAVAALGVRDTSTRAVADEFGISREQLYNWRRQLLGKEATSIMGDITKEQLSDDLDKLNEVIKEREQHLRKVNIEIAIREGTRELIKKGQGTDPLSLTNKEKTILVDALKPMIDVRMLLETLALPRSSYYYQRLIASKPDKYEELRIHIIELFYENKARFGYRRIYGSCSMRGRLYPRRWCVISCAQKTSSSSARGAVNTVPIKERTAQRPKTSSTGISMLRPLTSNGSPI